MTSGVQVSLPLNTEITGCGNVARTHYLPYLAGVSPFLRITSCPVVDEMRARQIDPGWEMTLADARVLSVRKNSPGR